MLNSPVVFVRLRLTYSKCLGSYNPLVEAKVLFF